jgi:hypothetical protein
VCAFGVGRFHAHSENADFAAQQPFGVRKARARKCESMIDVRDATKASLEREKQ